MKSCVMVASIGVEVAGWLQLAGILGLLVWAGVASHSEEMTDGDEESV